MGCLPHAPTGHPRRRQQPCRPDPPQRLSSRWTTLPRRCARWFCYLRTANAGTPGQRLLRAASAPGWSARPCTAGPWPGGSRTYTTLAHPGLRGALALLADHQADALLATNATHLAVDAAVTSQLAALAAQQGWQLLTVTPTPASTTVAPATTVVDRSRGPGRGGARR